MAAAPVPYPLRPTSLSQWQSARGSGEGYEGKNKGPPRYHGRALGADWNRGMQWRLLMIQVIVYGVLDRERERGGEEGKERKRERERGSRRRRRVVL